MEDRREILEVELEAEIEVLEATIHDPNELETSKVVAARLEEQIKLAAKPDNVYYTGQEIGTDPRWIKGGLQKCFEHFIKWGCARVYGETHTC